ncbi:Bro-N domain-containing protein [Castellaniella sp.]|uniref:BRO-N domain-containing protein n=1 Tax=Castellaniella sp. TaxID=1955812 RepID=UPI002AFF60E0|nr:Bro-N domain-containing protein [Castellaniella sp.]
MTDKIKLFDTQQVRAEWDADHEKWWFSVVDIIAILTESVDAAAYWRKLKQRLKAEGNQTVTACHGLKMQAADGKQRLTDVADTEQILRLIQSIPSKRAEPFKLWLAQVGSERLDETVDPEQSIDRAIQNYRRLGYSENWINQRIKSIEVRKALTDEWDKAGVQQGQEYAALTDLMSRVWSGLSTREYKQHKGLKKENLRDNMTNTELVLNMLAEVAATDISLVRNPQGLAESATVAAEGAQTAKAARLQLEKSTGQPVVSRLNAKALGTDKIGHKKK